ncbi:hypothetical protein NUW58_g676 [Xylaria curta]|uniref:Uncharacterized protein n=1 Tax=Xylaria curta TaxID=42375 RepID=A0ACC1PPC4_9PEZI|nr:hypothetical protein NUW58_g676 [Xylaria curta]
MATFTALNGGESKTAEGVSRSPITRHVSSEDRSAVQVASREANSGDASIVQAEQSSNSSLERPRYQSRSYPETEGTHKRKRSLSVERSREATGTQDQDQRSQAESRATYEFSPRERDYRHYGEDQREQNKSWYSPQQSRDDRNLYESRDPVGSVTSQVDEQAGDTLRRAPSHADSGHDYSATSPDGDESSLLYSSTYSQDQSRDPVIQSDPKKRKRNFSNRTKTGCLTCRKRKKKCDESKPECTNCVRGGFVCYGYPNQRGPPRMESKPAAVPLESKDPSYVPPGAYGMPQPQHISQPPTYPCSQATQKEEMLLGREYYPFESELVLERQRCSAACWRFNNSTNPNTGVSPTERSRLFREILNPREPIHLSPQIASSTTRAGRVGQEVVVEAPFTCDYGYNITIGNNVMIGRNCTILDPVEINIGDNCIIGPNVTLLGSTAFADPKKRMGSKSTQIGGHIIIDEDVLVGAGAIIQHGIRIGRGASISAGAVVVKDVPRYTVVAGNPAEVKSILYQQ